MDNTHPAPHLPPLARKDRSFWQALEGEAKRQARQELVVPQLNKIKATLEKITGKQVVVTNDVDPTIIGGIIAKVGDLVLDGSIKSQLKGLEESIKGSE